MIFLINFARLDLHPKFEPSSSKAIRKGVSV
jgi:hypothetical protein